MDVLGSILLHGPYHYQGIEGRSSARCRVPTPARLRLGQIFNEKKFSILRPYVPTGEGEHVLGPNESIP